MCESKSSKVKEESVLKVILHSLVLRVTGISGNFVEFMCFFGNCREETGEILVFLAVMRVPMSSFEGERERLGEKDVFLTGNVVIKLRLIRFPGIIVEITYISPISFYYHREIKGILSGFQVKMRGWEGLEGGFCFFGAVKR